MPETVILAVLGTLDAFSTAWFLHTGLAVEANPILEPFARTGWMLFLVVKLALVFGPLWGIEVLNSKLQDTTNTRRALRCAFAFYLGVYLMGVGAQLPSLIVSQAASLTSS